MAILGLIRSESLDSLASSRNLQTEHLLAIAFNLTGYGYVIAWGISFYPQLILNWRRKSTAGMSIGFQWYNVLGFLLYLIYTTYSPDATFQDQIFAAHALLVTGAILGQVPTYGVNKLGDFPLIHGKMIAGIVVFLDFALAMNLAKVVSAMTLVYTCGYVKDVISIIKYTPQVYLNWQRRSTVGFAITMVFCDITGGVLSIVQQAVACKYDPSSDSIRSAWSWEPFTGNKPKTILGLIAIFYDCIFLYQRFVLYGPKARREVPSGVGPGTNNASLTALPSTPLKPSQGADDQDATPSPGTDNPQDSAEVHEASLKNEN